MKSLHISLIVITIIIIGFVMWSMSDVVCIPCIIPQDAPENYTCSNVCNIEPRWYFWLR